MKTHTHTPGPWIQQTGMIYRADGFKDHRFSAPDGLLLAQVMAHRDHGPALAIAEANARLISAAPEMLDALKWARGIVNDYWHANTTEEKNHFAQDMQSAIDTMSKAISKAEGRA